jgi:hypothetical protein
MKFLSRMAIPGTGEVQLVIELTDPSLVQALAAPAARGAAAQASAGAGRGRLNLDSPEAQTYRAQLLRAQGLVISRLNALDGIRVQDTLDVVMNAVIARVPLEQYFAVRQLPGVKKVYFSRLHRMRLNAAAVVHNTAGLWAQAGGQSRAGQGMKVAIADTGIDITNPMFTDNSLSVPSGFPKGETAFTNRKVIVARNYVNLLNNPQSNHTAVDEVGHGSFVAGCAAGKQVAAPLATISGMAPGAYLGNYKIFGTPGINDFTNTAAILAALNAAVGDGMDVINLSLGSLTYVPPSEDAEALAVDSAVAAGAVVVLAAGNEGPETHTINNPGASPSAITVGGASNSRYFSSQLHVTGPGAVPAGLQNIGYALGTGPAIAGAIPATPVTDVASLDGTGLACSALPSGSLNGKLSLIQRGTCTFAVKVTNATNAGAVGAVVYDNVPGEPPISMGGLTSTIIPSVMVSNGDGLAIKAFLAANPGATISIDPSNQLLPTATTSGIILDLSSRGPAADLGIKPDLVAVGQNVYSAAQNTYPAGALYDATHFTSSEGTSFSTAIVSGAVAAVKQLFPSFTPARLKSALVTTASHNLTSDGAAPADILQGGGGLLDMGSAAFTGTVFAPSSLSFGVQSYSEAVSITRTLVITNVAAASDQYVISVNPLIPGPDISLSSAATGSVPAGGSTSISVTLQAAAPTTGGFQGFISVQSAQTSKVYQIPYWAGIYVPDSSRILTVSQSSTAAGVFPDLTAALRAARPGNIIEIADSQTYPVGLTLNSNREGLPLHGITIRAAAGQTPVLDGTATTAPATLEVVGLRNVLLQGLTINGGPIGVLLTQPSTTQRLSVTLDHCTISNASGGSFIGAVYDETGGDIDITYCNITGSSGSGVLVMNGTQLTMSGCTVQGNQSDGVDALDSNVDLISSTITGNVGVGAYLVNCTGTLDKNTFSRNTGFFGDGVEIGDGAITVTGNTFDANDSAGVYLFSSTRLGSGPAVLLERNIIQSNGDYGVQSDQARDLRMIGNLIKDNGLGFSARGTTSALLVNDLIVRSRGLSVGNGADLGGLTSVRMVNCTIYKNQAHGIAVSAGATLSVLNTIVSQNAGGDLQGLSAGSIQYSLIGDGTLAGGANIQGDPKFSNPETDDFSLASGSPAIDAGSNAATNLPFLDYNRLFRIAGTGSLPGDGKVDLGAIEAGSSYPLVYPLVVNGYNPMIADNYTTGIAVMNNSPNPVSAAFAAYSQNGTLISGGSNPTGLIPLAGGAQIPILGYELFSLVPAAGEIGGVLASSAQPVTGFFLVFDRDFKRLSDGADVSAETAAQLFFMRHQFDAAGKAVYALFNPGVNAATINASLLNSDGTQIDRLAQPLVLAPKGQGLFVFSNFTASAGMVRVDSDRPVSGLQLFGNTAEIAALRGIVPGTEARIFFPHIAVNQGYTSVLGVVNTSGARANLLLTAYRDDGSILGTPAQRTVNGGGQLLESASSLFGLAGGGIITGYVVVEGDRAGINGFCAFRYESGAVQSSAAVPASGVPQKKLLFSHVAHLVPAGTGGNYQTGIALLNPFGTPISYTMKVFDRTGRQVAEKTDTLGPHQKIARILSHPLPGAAFFNQRLVLAGGHIEVTSDYQLLGFELFFSDDVSELSAVVAQFPLF